MTIPTTSVSLSAIATEFGAAINTPLGSFYRGGTYVNTQQPDMGYGLIPTSGTISFSSFRNATKAFIFNYTPTGTVTNVDMSAQAIAAGWNQTSPIIINATINSGVIVAGSGVANYAFSAYRAAGWPTYSKMNLTVNSGGYIVGFGGQGGQGFGLYLYATQSYGASQAGSAGSAGGPAMLINISTTLVNSGTIGGGGGAGGGGQAGNYVYVTGGGEVAFQYTMSPGSGGGGGAPYISAISGGSQGTIVQLGNASQVGYCYTTSGETAALALSGTSQGSVGSMTAGGAGGPAATTTAFVQSGGGTAFDNGYAGGSGGALGAVGAAGGGGTGGAAGAAGLGCVGISFVSLSGNAIQGATSG
jgi:hypothetical protein